MSYPYEWMDTMNEPPNFGICSRAIKPLAPEQEAKIERLLDEMTKAAEEEEENYQREMQQYVVW